MRNRKKEMVKREDGKETRKRVLHAACDLFSDKGFRRTTVADICRSARANQASVNYYFRDKAGLYIECWKYAVARFGEDLFTKRENTPPREQLRHYIFTLMKNLGDTGEKGYFIRFYMMELVNPTGLIQDSWHETIQPRRRALHRIICSIMGQDPGQEILTFCELSIVGQCRMLLGLSPNDIEYFLGRHMDEPMINRLADHITSFSLAGIRAQAAQIPLGDGGFNL